MTYEYELKLSQRTDASRDDPLRTFYWSAEGPSSFQIPFGPRMGSIGPVQPANIDFVRLAVLVLAADRSTPRAIGRTNWSSRDFALTVPVRDHKVWEPTSDQLAETLGFLTGDTWTIRFRSARPKKEQIVKELNLSEPARVVLMSGGADSALGVLESRQLLSANESHVLVSHVGLTALAPIQREVAETAARLAPTGSQVLRQIHLIRRKVQVDGSKFKNEKSSRSRSFLFLALGLAYASIHGVPLWIPENGFASLNPPLSPSRRGSLSTRTTHPAFLQGISELLKSVGGQSEIVNPFSAMTKGQMFRAAADEFGDAEIERFLSATHSCGLTGQRSFGISPTIQCGVCFGCVVRRASFAAANLSDTTEYINTRGSKKLARWLDGNSIVPDMRRFLQRGVRRPDLAAMSLPSDYPLSSARDLCEQAAQELRDFIV